RRRERLLPPRRAPDQHVRHPRTDLLHARAYRRTARHRAGGRARHARRGRHRRGRAAPRARPGTRGRSGDQGRPAKDPHAAREDRGGAGRARPGPGSGVKVTVLGSGSAGNATLVEAGGTRLLVDAGFSGRDRERRMLAVDVDPESLDGIVITHEHGDHTRGMGVLARRHGIPLYLTPVTRRACQSLLTGDERIVPYRSGEPFRVGALEVRPFLTVHDAVDPVAVAVRDVATGLKLGIATDMGRPTASVRHALSDCHLLVLEANHDEVMLRDGPYPWSVKQR